VARQLTNTYLLVLLYSKKCTWNYCTVGDASLDLFAFDLYDEDGSGRLGQDELVQMLKDIYGRNYKNNQQAKM
jgi:hypothetical protein